jgi:hypothetical protein
MRVFVGVIVWFSGAQIGLDSLDESGLIMDLKMCILQEPQNSVQG